MLCFCTCLYIIYMYMYMYICRYIHVLVHTYTCTYMYMYIQHFPSHLQASTTNGTITIKACRVIMLHGKGTSLSQSTSSKWSYTDNHPTCRYTQCSAVIHTTQLQRYRSLVSVVFYAGIKYFSCHCIYLTLNPNALHCSPLHLCSQSGLQLL